MVEARAMVRTPDQAFKLRFCQRLVLHTAPVQPPPFPPTHLSPHQPLIAYLPPGTSFPRWIISESPHEG